MRHDTIAGVLFDTVLFDTVLFDTVLFDTVTSPPWPFGTSCSGAAVVKLRACKGSQTPEAEESHDDHPQRDDKPKRAHT